MHGHSSIKSTAVLLSRSALIGCAVALCLRPATAQTSDNVIYLNQAWSQDDREWYYHFSQGSAVLSYDIFLNVEVADGQELFRSDANLVRRYRMIPEAANSINPDGLPIGLSKTRVAKPIKGWPAGDYIGVTCAACHEGQLTYRGKHVRIDGGIGHTFDFQATIQGLDAALQATSVDSARFDRFAARLSATSPDAKDQLRKRLADESARVHEYATRTSITPHPWGPGRMDALTMIADRVTATLTGIPENWSPGTAPVKPPFLWNAPQGTWTQWAAIVADPIHRNFGEIMGVYMPIDLSSKSPAEGLFSSAAVIPELVRVESQLERLAPPSWPEDVFGKIDRAKAKVGQALFMEHCASCHNAWPYRWTEPNQYGKRFVLVGLVPQTYVGTDRTQFDALRPLAVTGALSKYLPPEFKGKELLPTRIFLLLLQAEVRERAIAELKLSESQSESLHGYRGLAATRPPEGVWKAAPRDGVWATAPFLHNGSVPNLYEMLIPAAERTKKFWLGGDFDPVRVGLDTTATSGTFLMDTTLLGNSNRGHSFQEGPRGNGVVGPLLTDDERWAIVEYVKSIPEQPGRVTPFGGFTDASPAPKP
jgi:mono/diheme cytochrome c family protein